MASLLQGKNLRAQLAKRFGLSGVALLLGLLVGEVCLRWLAPERELYAPWKPNFSYVFRPARGLMPGVEGDATFVTNSLGIRGDELTRRHDYRVLCIGASTTECAFLDQAEQWPAVVQRELERSSRFRRPWVGNCGKSGLRSEHHVLQMQYLAQSVEEVDVVVVLMGINDLTRFLKSSHRPAATLESTFEVLPATAGRNRFEPRLFAWTASVARRSRVAQSTVVDEAGLAYARWRENRKSASHFVTSLPDLSLLLVEYAQNIDRLVALARHHDLDLVLVSQPVMWSNHLTGQNEELLWLGGIGNFQAETGLPYYSTAALASGMAELNQLLAHKAAAWDVAFVDLAAVLSGNPVNFYDDCHFTEAGAQRVGELVASTILAPRD